MKRLGSDMLALACIAGGAVVSGAATLALANGPEEASYECTTSTVRAAPKVVVSLGGEGVVAVSPDVRVRTSENCGDGPHVVEIEGLHVERAQRALERAQAEVERTQVRVESRMVRVQERAERGRERMERARERMERARERGQRRIRVERIGEDRLDPVFEFRFRGMDDETLRLELGETLGLRLGELGALLEMELGGAGDEFGVEMDDLAGKLELELRGLEEALEGELEGLDADIENRLHEEMKRLEERLERVGSGNGV